MSFESLNQLSATTMGGGSSRPRLAKAARVSSSIASVHSSLVRQRRPAPLGLGLRAAKSTDTPTRPSRTTLRHSTPPLTLTTRLYCPLYQLPTNARGPLYLRNTESSMTGVSCQRLRVAGLIDWARRQMALTIS